MSDKKGIKVTLKDGSIGHYDPCKEIIIDIGWEVYRIPVDDIEKIETYVVEDKEGLCDDCSSPVAEGQRHCGCENER